MKLDDKHGRGLRVREVREALGDRQADFAQRLCAAATELAREKVLHYEPVHYDGPIVSKMETAVREISIDDVAVVARARYPHGPLDEEAVARVWIGWGPGVPLAKARKMLWLAWGEPPA